MRGLRETVAIFCALLLKSGFVVVCVLSEMKFFSVCRGNKTQMEIQDL